MRSRRYAQPPELAAPLGDELLPHGQRGEAPGLEIVSQPDEERLAERDGAWLHPIDPSGPCPSVAPDPVPGHDLEGRIAHEVVEVIEATVGVVDGPTMQLRLDLQYPGRLVEARPRRVSVHRRPSDVPARRLRTRCPPSPCGRLSRPRTTTGTPSPRRAVGRRRAFPASPWRDEAEGSPARVPTFTTDRLTGWVSSFSPAASPRLRRRPSPWPPVGRLLTDAESSATTRDGRALLTGPHPPGSSRLTP